MEKIFAKLQRIDNNSPITWDTNSVFLCHLQRALLMALQERGILDRVQLHQALEGLQKRRREYARLLQEDRG